MSTLFVTGRVLAAANTAASANFAFRSGLAVERDQTRNMATLREVQMRLKSISNISKITKSMKMISSTKMARAQKSMVQARQWGQTSQAFVDHAEVAPEVEGKTMYLTVSSDSGLCGGIHSSVSKATRRALADKPEAGLVIIGDKAKAQLQRSLRDQISLTFSQVGKSVPQYAESCAIADEIRGGVDGGFGKINVIYNRFNSVISYEATTLPIYAEGALTSAGQFAAYEVEDDVLDNLQEFLMANAIHWAIVEGHASEMAAKRTAMENATKNAGDIIDKLTMIYNRGRQAVITNELVEIITGASAL
ncbi:atp3 gamma subunit of the F1 sector of mitochondrial F1F0 ATP synthase [Tieghemiomyces parasiticus]|uniref:ATP synthase subunit gamma n=1 Tax=Tieghemiomyces parasiticus TaxID=78921 RepID=A0A9W8ALR0_9FUNG|nr:atp3 gamma subunit of the F1 sector of mitochondrial F1F0 ATP synthase [Tieghemiomyces parasiticus]